MRRLKFDIGLNQWRLSQGKLVELDTSEWVQSETEVSKLMTEDEYGTLWAYHTELADIQSKEMADDATMREVFAHGTQSQGITDKYSTGWHRYFGPLPRFLRRFFS